MAGKRRIDRIRDEAYLQDLAEQEIAHLRSMRDECEEEEAGVSFARRLVQGRLDILRAEVLRRRDAGLDGAQGLLERLPSILADEGHTPVGRTRAPKFLVPPSVKYHRRAVERIAGETVLSALDTHDDDSLAELIDVFASKEHELSSLRRELLDRIDALQAEIAKRYKSGAASVRDVLAPSGD